MKFIFSILALVLTVKECGPNSGKTQSTPLTTAQNSKTTMQQDTPIIQYTASTRGYSKDITVSASEVVVKINKRGSQSVDTIKTTPESWDAIMQKIKGIEVVEMPNWPPPTTDRYTDAAAIANIKIMYPDTTFTSQNFDNGNPPKQLKPLCDAIIKLSESDRSKNDTSHQNAIHGNYSVTRVTGLENETVKNKKLTLNFGSDRVSGFNGCNSYTAQYTIKNDAISVGIMITTKRYCEDPLKTEGTFMAKLRATNRFVIQENVLTLFADNEVLIKAEKKSEKE